jgi:lipid A ethanolaminephosphotransferase
MGKRKVDGLCRDDECLDEILLQDLQTVLDRAPGDLFVVLHQKGSHGPLYYKRVPDAFRKFTPECRQDEVQKCSQEEIVNSYDNTILYTDHFLAEAIDFLKSNAARYDAALLYMSDHGESLGENGIYLHGAPYFIAPEEQTHIPFVAWLSAGLAQDAGIDVAGLKTKTAEPYAHDHLFHSVLGLFDIKTDAYRADLDLFAPWRNPVPEQPASRSASSGG